MKNLLFLFIITLMFACDPPKKEAQVEATPENTTKLEPIQEAPVVQEVDSTTVDKAPEEIVPKTENE